MSASSCSKFKSVFPSSATLSSPYTYPLPFASQLDRREKQHNDNASRHKCRRGDVTATWVGHPPWQDTYRTHRLGDTTRPCGASVLHIPLTSLAGRSLDHLEERYGEDHAEQHDAGDADADAAQHDGVVLGELFDARLAAGLVGVLLGAGQRGARRTAGGGHRDDAAPPVRRTVHAAALHLCVCGGGVGVSRVQTMAQLQEKKK